MKHKLCDGYVRPAFSADSATVIVRTYDQKTKTTMLRLFELATARELARTSHVLKGRSLQVGTVSPNGKFVAVYSYRTGQPLEVWLLDAKTLDPLGKFTTRGECNAPIWESGLFTPDSRYFVAVDREGTIFIWNLDEQKMQRTLSLDGTEREAAMSLAISPDSQTLAIAWQKKYSEELIEASDQLSVDYFPQPRVTLIDLAGKAAARTLIAPNGYNWHVVFSPHGKTLAMGGVGAVYLFDLGIGH